MSKAKTIAEFMVSELKIDLGTIDRIRENPKMASVTRLIDAPFAEEIDPKTLEDAANTLIMLERGHDISGTLVAKALLRIAKALRKGLDIATINPEKIPNRPPQDGLTPALYAFAKALRDHGTKLAAVPVNPDSVEKAAQSIDRLRAAYEPLATCTEQIKNNLAIAESESVALLRDKYELIRPLVQADPDLEPTLRPVEAYLYGAAEKAQITRKDNERKVEELADKAERRGQLEAEAKAHQRLNDIFSNVMTKAFEPPGKSPPQNEGTKDDRNRPR